MTRTPSLVTARSVSSVVTPMARAKENAAIVFSGRNPRAPRCPWRSKECAGVELAASANAASSAAQRVIERASPAREDAREPRGRRRTPESCGRGASTMLASPVDAMLWKHSSVQHSECGVTITLSIASSGLSGVDRLLLEHVERGAGDAARLQRGDQRRLVDDRSARDVDEIRGRLHPARIRGAPIRWRVSSSSRQHVTTKSDSRSRVSRSTLRAPT